MERELLIAGIGGQGVQLAGRLLALSLTSAGRDVQLFGSYGGMMRGGNTEVTLVVGRSAVQSPPTVSPAWSAIVMHDAYAGGIEDRIRPGGLLVVNSTVCRPPRHDGEAPAEPPDAPPPGGPGRGLLPDTAVRTLAVPATRLATELGSVAAATMVALGAYVAATDIVGLADLLLALPEALPRYRHEQLPVDAEALAAGFGAVPVRCRPAWAEVPV
ncbi:2-oxoacid:acceptor oxidoreductase family protein [Streptomyces sp. NPDC006487]|uniref:2-oxoacid:acceptor oxidoreductase family protein n=1 Tax=Streptomyces sp. NPDC006487 TaxID=3364748 RepID=UPI003694AFD1